MRASAVLPLCSRTLGEAGVGFGTGVVGGDGGLKLLFGLGDEALGEIVASELRVLRGLLGFGEGGHAEGAHLVELEGGLTEGGFGVGAADAFERIEAGGVGEGGAGFCGSDGVCVRRRCGL